MDATADREFAMIPFDSTLNSVHAVAMTGIAMMVLCARVTANPEVQFEVTVEGGQTGTYHTTWVQSGSNITHTNSPFPAGLIGPLNQWSLEWNLNADDEVALSNVSYISGNLVVRNQRPDGPAPTDNHLQFTITIQLPVQYGGTCGQFSGSTGVSLTEQFGTWNGVISTIGSNALWTALIDGQPVATLFNAPSQLMVAGGSGGSVANNASLTSGQTAPLALIPINSIGLRITFDLTPGEHFSMTNLFIFQGGTIWKAPAGGVYHNTANWSSGLPTGNCHALFGSSVNTNPYTVTFTNNVTQYACSVTNQHPTFNLGGFDFALSDRVRIGAGQSASLAITNGTLTSPTTEIEPYGILSGDSMIIGNVTNTGTIRPGRLDADGGNVLTLNGDLHQQPSGMFESQFNSTANGRLTINGNATLGGTMRMTLLPGADPQTNQFYPVLSATGTMVGTFNAAVLPFLGPDKVVGLQYVYSASDAEINGAPDSGEVAEGALSNGHDDDHSDSLGPGGSGVAIVIGSPGGSPDFGDPQEFVLAGQPTGVTDAQVQQATTERDLALSIAANDPQDNGLALILLNNGGGATFTPIIEEVGHEPSGIVCASLADGSERDDFAVPNRGDDTVTVLFYDGASAYTALTVPVGLEPSAIATADLDNDRMADLVVTNQANNTVTVLINNGDRTFTPQSPIPVGGGPASIAAVDLLGSSLPDLIIANSTSDNVTILENLGGGTYAPVTIPVGPKPIIVNPTDVDNDRDLDIVISIQNGGSIAVISNLGGGSFALPVNLPVDGAPGSLASWDMDGDSDQDMVVITEDVSLDEPVIRVLRNDSTPAQLAFTLFDPLGQGESPRLVNGSDVTGDALEDLVSVNVVSLPLAMHDPKGDHPRNMRSNINGTSLNGPPRPGDSTMRIREALLDTRPLCRADVAPIGNLDGMVGVSDLLFIINNWGPCANPRNCPADIAPAGPPVGDDTVGVPDLLYIINNWGPCP